MGERPSIFVGFAEKTFNRAGTNRKLLMVDKADD